jgi:hypothetical protein
MKFIKSHKRKYYETWHYIDKENDCIVHIHHIQKAKNYENGVYHFTVVGNDFKFSSIKNDMIFIDFNECVAAIEKLRMIGLTDSQKEK